MAKHELVSLTASDACCKCGWFSCLLRRDSFGFWKGLDELLDRYLAHRKRGGSKGGAGWDSRDDRDEGDDGSPSEDE